MREARLLSIAGPWNGQVVRDGGWLRGTAESGLLVPMFESAIEDDFSDDDRCLWRVARSG